MNLVSRHRVRDPNVLASTASESPGNTRYKSQSVPQARSMCSKQVRGDPYWALAHQTTQNGTLTTSGLLKSGNLVKCRTQVRRDPYMTSLSWWYGLWHRHRIEPVSKITIILEQRQWSIAKNAGPFSRRCNSRHRHTFYDLENVYVFEYWKHLKTWERITWKFYIPSKIHGNISL